MFNSYVNSPGAIFQYFPVFFPPAEGICTSGVLGYWEKTDFGIANLVVDVESPRILIETEEHVTFILWMVETLSRDNQAINWCRISSYFFHVMPVISPSLGSCRLHKNLQNAWMTVAQIFFGKPWPEKLHGWQNPKR